MRSRLALLVSAMLAMSACGDNLAAPSDADRGPQCHDGLDNDGDGLFDFPDDPGCESVTDDSEDSPAMPQCMDHRDNDGDGKTDYPDDPGCNAPNQDSEVDSCPGAGCPQCADGIDNDGNGKIDFPDDSGCTSASDNDEFDHNPVACGMHVQVQPLPPTNTAEGVLAIANRAALPNACGIDGALEVPALAYELHLASNAVVEISADGSGVDTIIDVRKAPCDGPSSSLACKANDGTAATGPHLFTALPAGNYYIIIETPASTVVGTYKLQVTLFSGEGTTCVMDEDCGPGLVCRIKPPNTMPTCEKHVCMDGIDNDGDGKVDYPFDPGCAAPDSDDEADTCPAGPGCPACADGIDNDGDGHIDYPDDPNCSAASSGSEACVSTEGVTKLVAAATSGTTVGATNDFNPTCASSAGSGPDRTYELDLPPMLSLDINLTTSYDSVHELLGASCSGTALSCSDPTAMHRGATPAGIYFLVIDGWNATSSGTYTINVSGTIAPGGSCEPADTLNGALTCGATNPCTGTVGSRICRFSQCGDGIDNDGDGKIDYPNEPGCTSLLDDDETDSCPGTGCPQCADGIDNDGDGHIDYPADTNCVSASSTSEQCVSTETVSQITTASTSGTTVGATNDFNPTCASTLGSGPDRTYELDLPSMLSLDINLTTSYDSVHELLGATCGGTALSCSDPTAMHRGVTPAGQYFLVIDGYSSTSAGTYTINVSGTIAPGGSCEPAATLGGALSCPASNPCTGAVGSRICRAAACNDGIDNDGDGKIDFPAEPGCTTAFDEDETDTCPGAGCPQCADGIDNDGDGHIDWPADINCTSASGTSEQCVSAEPVAAIVAAVTTGTTVGATNDFNPTCASTAGSGPDLTYVLDVPQLDSLDINLSASFDSAHELLGASCGGAALACSDPTTLHATSLAAGQYFVVIDGYSSTASGAFSILTSGRIHTGASCEGVLAKAGALSCAVGTACLGAVGSRTCQVPQCSDGIDNNGDGTMDYPADPGCDSPLDNTETTVCPGGTCPVCLDGTNNDADAMTDYPGDLSCWAASGTDEAFCNGIETDKALAITQATTIGTTVGLHSDMNTQTCQATATGPDVAFSFNLPVATTTMEFDTIDTGTSFDTILSLRSSTCVAGTQLDCSDDAPGGTRSIITHAGLPAGNYSLILDGYSGTSGTYVLHAHGLVANGTACTSPLFANGVLACTAPATCNAGTCN